MTNVYIADLRAAELVDDREGAPPVIEGALTAGTEVRLWPTSGVSDADLPQRGDYILFVATHPDRSLVRGVGQVYDIAHSAIAEQMLSNSDISVDDADPSIATIVNYVTFPYEDRPWFDEIFEEYETVPGNGRWLLKVPEEVLQNNNFVPPIRGLARFEHLDTTRFESSPGPPDGDRPPYEGPQDGGDDDGNGIDRSGPLLAQQYTSRDSIRSASKDTLQITILLFGVVVAGLSFLRDAIRNGAVEISEPMVIGGFAIALGAVLAGAVFVWTVTKPRPLADSLSQFHARINAQTIGKQGAERNDRLITLSERYHQVVQTIRSSNAGLGAVVGVALGVALSGIFLMTIEVINQYPGNYQVPFVAVVALIGVTMIMTIYSTFRAAQERSDF